LVLDCPNRTLTQHTNNSGPAYLILLRLKK
jgi:hypothetical protein